MSFKPDSNFGDVPLPLEPIEALRLRLAHQWSRHKARHAYKLFGKPNRERYNPKWDEPDWIDTGDSLAKWLMTEPEDIVRKWEARAEREYLHRNRKSDPETIMLAFQEALKEVLPLMFTLMWTEFPRGTVHKISLEELTANDAFKALDEPAQWVARWCVECQQQNTKDEWEIVPEPGEVVITA